MEGFWQMNCFIELFFCFDREFTHVADTDLVGRCLVGCSILAKCVFQVFL